MKIRNTGPLLIIIGFGGISPALADCCSSVWDCAATVVTEGVSCEVQTIIDTIKSLVTEVTNFGNDVTGITSAKEQGARAYVSDTINLMQSQSQQGGADLAAALSQAQTLYKQESTYISEKSASLNTQNVQAVSGSSNSGPPKTETAQIASKQVPNGAPVSMTALRSQAVAPVAASGNPMLQKSTIGATTDPGLSPRLVAAPHGTYSDAFARGVKQLIALKSTGDADLAKVSRYLAQAQSSEGPGVAAADTIAGTLTSPISAINSQLSAMLTHPLDAFDPSSMVDDMETTITKGMSSDIPKMIDDITNGPNQAFAAAQPTYDDLLANAESAQQLAAAMAKVYRLRTTAAADALYALLPKIDYAGLTSKATTRSLAGNFGQRKSYAVVTANDAAAKQKLRAVAYPPSLAKIHTLVAQFKAQRAQGRSAQAPSMVQMYRTNVSRQLDGYFAGKSPAGVATQRDQLVAEARTRFAKDPKVENGVIGIINSEAEKYASARNAAIPGQPLPRMTTAAAAKNSLPVAMTLPAAAMTSARPQTGLVPAAAPSAVPPVNGAPNQPKIATWGTPSAWTPPPAAGAPAATLRTPGMAFGAPAMAHAVTEIKPAPSPTTSAPQACNTVGNKLPCLCVKGSSNNPAGCTVMGWDVTKNHAL